MKGERYKELTTSDKYNLTKEELSRGWHFCHSEWDNMLIHSSWPEYEVCKCKYKLDFTDKTNG